MKRGLISLAFVVFLILVNFVSSLENNTINVLVSVEDNSIFKTNKVEMKNDVAEELGDKYDVNYVAQSFNGITLTVTQEELEELQDRKDIEVQRIPEFKTLLQDSTIIINSSLTNNLQLNGVNLTGIGQGICIIDSGVNYSHHALGNCTKEQFLSGQCGKVVGGYAYYNPVNASNLNDVMGDSNHGTHVAGIAVGQGALQGVASGAHIAAIKACGPGSGCDLAAMIDGINWCVGNATNYNLSVISISIGTSSPDLFNTACDSAVPSLTSAINNAVGKNISVVIASGNDGNNTHISLPACISNATAVGATNNDDTMASYGNRNSLISLLAPGTGINSSILSGGYGELQGTSMATPHVSGAIAILRQILASLNITKTPSELETMINNTGKNITDSTGVTYSRINVHNAVLPLDRAGPLISVNGIENSTNSSQLFSASFSDWQLGNVTLYVWNSSGTMIYNQSANLTGSINSTSINFLGIDIGSYNWTFNASDANGNESAGEISTLDIVGLEAISPEDGYSITAESKLIDFNFTLHDLTNFTNCTLSLSSTGNYSVNITNNLSNYNISTSIGPSTQNWNIYCYDEAGNEYVTGNRSIIITAPEVQVASTSRSGGGGGGGGASIIFTANGEAIEQGYTQSLSKAQKIQFTLFDSDAERHTLTVDAVTDEYVNVTIRSDPIKLILGVGQSAKLNLSSADFYDLYIKLEKIENKKATLTIQTIREEIAKASPIDGNVISEDEDNNASNVDKQIKREDKLSVSFWLHTILLVIFLTAGIVHWLDMRRN